jgi:ribosomal protein S12 methylthiotransferase accessory factor
MISALWEQPRCPALEPYLIDEEVGVIHLLRPEIDYIGSPAFFHHSALLCLTEFLTGIRCIPRVAAASADRIRSRELVVHRAVAAYCASFYVMRDLIPGASETLSEAHVDPDEFVGFAVDQYATPGFPWVPFETTTPVRWIAASNLLSEEHCLVPAAMVFLPYSPDPAIGEAPIAPPSPTGLSCEDSLERAIAAAICGVVAADALAIVWQCRVAPPQIRIETLSDLPYELIARLERAGDQVYLLDCTMDSGVPVVLSVLLNNGDGPALVCGAGCSLHRDAAVMEALENLAHARWRSREVKAKPAVAESDRALADIAGGRDHLSFWSDPANVPFCDFLLSSRQRKEFDDLPDVRFVDASADVAALTRQIDATGHRIFYIDLSTDEIARLGLRVVRAVIPGYQPLWVGPNMQPRSGRRLEQPPCPCPSDVDRRASSLAFLPHPFAAHGYYND